MSHGRRTRSPTRSATRRSTAWRPAGRRSWCVDRLPAPEPDATTGRLAAVMRDLIRSLRQLVLPLFAFVAVVAVLAACDAEPPPPQSGSPAPALAGTSWTIISVGASRPIPGTTARLSFGADTLGGFGGCNHFGGGYTFDRLTGRFSIPGPLAATLIGCLEPAVGAFESDYLEALQRADEVALAPDGRLVLSGPSVAIVLALDARPLQSD